MFPRHCPMNKKSLAIIFCLVVVPVFAAGQDCKSFTYDRWKAKISFCAPSEWESFCRHDRCRILCYAVEGPREIYEVFQPDLARKTGA